MKIEAIEDLWEKDSQIDDSDLGSESLKIPLLHHKYYKLYFREKLALEQKMFDLNVLHKEKWELYTGKLDKQTLAERGWEQFELNILRADISIYLDADKDLIKKKIELSLQKEKVEYLKDIIKVINNRAFHIKNKIDFMKWAQGSG